MLVCLELSPRVGLPKLPPRRCDIIANQRPAIASGHLEGEALAVEVGVALPILAPILRHCLPPNLRTFDRHGVDVAGATNIGDQDQIEIRMAVNREPNSSLLLTGDPD